MENLKISIPTYKNYNINWDLVTFEDLIKIAKVLNVKLSLTNEQAISILNILEEVGEVL